MPERSAHARRRAHPHRPVSHPAGRELRRAGGRHHRAARPQRRRQDHHACAPSWGCGAPRRAASCSAARASPALDTPTIAQRGIAFVPENMGLFTDLTVQENLMLAARSGPLGRGAARVAVRPVSAAQDVLAAAGRQSLRRPEADAVGGARADRAAPADPDRRADQGAGAGHRQVHDRGHRASSSAPTPPSCWWSRISPWPARSATRWR